MDKLLREFKFRFCARCQIRFLIVGGALLLSACAVQPSAPLVSPVNTLVALSPLSLLPTPTIIPTASAIHTPVPTPTIRPTTMPTVAWTPLPIPTLIPTVNPTELPDRLLSAIVMRRESNALGSHPLLSVTGWKYGMRSSEFGPYRWLDGTHLLLYPLTGEREGMGIYQETLPVVLNLNNGRTWLPVIGNQPYADDQPLWSDSLQVLISTQGQEILIRNPDGIVIQRYPGSPPLDLSPSGQRLLARFVWRDLETGQTVDFSGQHKLTMQSPGWSSDETRLFECCFGYANVTSGKYGYSEFGSLHQVGRDGGMLRSRWVLSDTRVMVEYDFFEGDKWGAIPLIDPAGQTYVDVRTQAVLNSNLVCGAPRIAPDGGRLWVPCSELSPSTDLSRLPATLFSKSFLVDLQTFITHTLPSNLGFDSWSPDSQFALFVQSQDWQTKRGEYALFPATGGDLYPVDQSPVWAPTWSPKGKHLAYLTQDRHTLTVLDVTTRTRTSVPLSQSSVSVFWRPQGNSLAVLTADGSLLWIPNPAANRVEQLTPPLPSVRDVRWSPAGDQLAFVSGADIYVVSVE